MKYIFVFFSFFYVFSPLFGQNYISGIILDSETKSIIPNAYIENISNNYIIEADSNGFFKIPAQIGDTLVFSSIGFYWYKYIVNDFKKHEFSLELQAYTLDAVITRPIDDYEHFKYKVLHAKTQKDSLQYITEFEKYYPIRNYTPGTIGYTFEGGITSLYNTYNRHARNALKAMELLENKHYIILANKKFNKELVIDLTHIPEEYFNSFMAHCSFSDEFLAIATEFQIITVLFIKYEEFQNIHPELKKL